MLDILSKATYSLALANRSNYLGPQPNDAAANTKAISENITLTNGNQYFNTTTNKLRITTNGVWGDYDATAQVYTTIATSQAAIAQAAVLGLPYFPIINASTAAGGSNILPQGITTGTVGGTAVTGATIGTYALTATGGSFTGVAANLVVTSATAATIVVTNPGRTTSASPTAPTWANPSGATIPGGTTLTANIGTQIGNGTGQFYLTSDAAGANLLYWQNTGTGAPVPVNGATGAQISYPLSVTVAALATSISALNVPIFADDPWFGTTIFVNGAGQVLTGITASGQIVNQSAPTLPVFADDPLFGLSIVIDINGHALLQYDASTGLITNVAGVTTTPIFADDPAYLMPITVNPAGVIVEIGKASTAYQAAVRGLRNLCPGMGMDGLRLIDPFAQAFNNSMPQTFQSIIGLAQGADGVQLIFENADPVNSLTITKACISTRADLDPSFDNNNAAAQVAVTFGGNASIVIPPAPSSKQSTFAVADMASISTISVTQGASGGIIVARAWVANPSATLILPYQGNFANPSLPNPNAQRSNGFSWSNRNYAGDCVTTPANFLATTEGFTSPIVGARYAARGLVCNILCVGDSIMEGYGDTIRSDAFPVRVARNLDLSISGVAFEASNLGYTGSETWNTFGRFKSFITAGLRADIVLYQGGSSNDTGTGTHTLTTTLTAGMAQYRVQAGQLCRAMGAAPLFLTWGPFGPSQYNYGTSDSVRLADNAVILAMGTAGVMATDISTPYVGGTTGGQQYPNPALTADGVVHESGVGYDVLSVPIIATIKSAIL